MADFDAQLPVRANDTDFHSDLSKIAGNAVSTGTGLSDAGTQRVTVATDDEQDVNLKSLGGAAVDTNAGSAGAATLRVVVASDQPVIKVDPTGISDKTNVTDFDQGSAVAALGTSTHTFTPTAATMVRRIIVSASGPIRAEIKIGVTASETTRAVLFTSSASRTEELVFDEPIQLAPSDSVVIDRKNMDDDDAFDVYSSVLGYLV